MSAEKDDLEKNLLTSLLALIRPLITSQIGLDSEDSSAVFSCLADVENGTEGKTLISAMKKFVEAAVLSSIHAKAASSENRDTRPFVAVTANDQDSVNDALNANPSTATDQGPSPDIPQGVNEAEAGVSIPQVPSGLPMNKFESMILTKTRAHVFNNMPIRLLEFDITGFNPRLIGRDKIFSRILQSVKEETAKHSFQREWLNALHLQGEVVSWDPNHPRSNRMNKLVSEAIEYGTHYSILSHTWIRGSPGDVVFGDWKKRLENPLGYAKIAGFCTVSARDHGITLGWLDTVCIDKDSSSELDESIRSMYKWYRGSKVCITFLSETENVDHGRHDAWFTRGWTLQELLAPKRLFFYNKNWIQLGSGEDDTIQSLIQSETSITRQELALCKRGEIDKIPLSHRMQMASRRQVTREEDSAYSLLGLLGVNISVAYGEGSTRALERLFRELLSTKKHVLDFFNRSYLFEDTLIPQSITRYSLRNIYFDFRDWGTQLDYYIPPEPILVTHLGVRVQVLLMPSRITIEQDDSGYKPKGDFYGMTKIRSVNKQNSYCFHHFYMLDSCLYTEEPPTLVPAEDREAAEVTDGRILRKTFAVLTFGIMDGSVILPEFCFGIIIQTPQRSRALGPDTQARLLGQAHPQHFQLKTTRNTRSVPIAELELHGMQLVTFYL